MMAMRPHPEMAHQAARVKAAGTGTPLMNMEDHWREHIHPDKRVLIIGPTKSGKTNMTFHVAKCMHSIRPMDFCMAFSKTETANGNYGGLGPKDFRLMPCFLTRSEIDLKLIASFNNFQMRAKRIGEAFPTLIIFDDVMCDKKTANQKEVNEVLMNMRNADVACITDVHGVKQFGPDQRDQFRMVIMFKISKGEAEKAWELFFSNAIGSKREFMFYYNKVMRQGKYWTFGIDLDAEGRENQLFKWKAPRYKFGSKDTKPGLPCPHIGHRDFWLLMRDAYNHDAQETTADVFNVDAVRARRGVRKGKILPPSGDMIVLADDDDDDILLH